MTWTAAAVSGGSPTDAIPRVDDGSDRVLPEARP